MAIHVAITRRVRPGREAEFQAALREFLTASLAHEGVLGVHMLTPAPASGGSEYGILRTFADERERDAFYASPLAGAGVYPTSLLLSLTVAEQTRDWPFPLRNLAFAAAMVGLLTWLVMPLVTRAVDGWLHPGEQAGEIGERA